MAWALVHLTCGGGEWPPFNAAQSAARHEWGRFSRDRRCSLRTAAIVVHTDRNHGVRRLLTAKAPTGSIPVPRTSKTAAQRHFLGKIRAACTQHAQRGERGRRERPTIPADPEAAAFELIARVPAQIIAG